MCPVHLNLLPLITPTISGSPNSSLTSLMCFLLQTPSSIVWLYISRSNLLSNKYRRAEYFLFCCFIYLGWYSLKVKGLNIKMDNMRQRDKTSPFKIRISVFLIYQIYDVVLRFANKPQDNVNPWKFNKTNFYMKHNAQKTIRGQTRYATYSETRDWLCSSISESNSQSSALSETLDHVWSDLPSSYKIFLKRVLNSRSLANRVNVSMCVVWYDIATGDQRTIGYGSAMVYGDGDG